MIQIRIPAQDAGAFTSRILPVKPGSVPTPLPPAVAETKPAAEPAKPEARPEAAKPETKAEPKPAPAKVSPANTASKPPEPRTTTAVDEKLLAKKTEAAPAKSAAGGEAWIVQLGAYRDPANVRNLTAKLKQQGYNFYTEALPSPEGSNRTRVRAGPFPSKEAAEAARERIKRIGVDGVVAQK